MSSNSFAQMTDAKDTGEGYLYGLGLIKLQTNCGTVYGHNAGAIYGYATEMYTTADGSRQAALSAAEGPTLPYTTLTGLTGTVALNSLCAAK